MAGGEITAIFKSLAEDAAKAGEDIGRSISKFAEKTADIEEENVERVIAADAESAEKLRGIKPSVGDLEGDGAGGSAGAGGNDPLGDLAGDEGAGKPSTGEPGSGDGANAPAGNGDAVGTKGVGKCGKAGEPVDVVTGQMITSRLDVFLPGVLPLALRRTYSSGYRGTGLFGPGFCSTLDMRVAVGPERIVFVDDDARKLAFPVPGEAGQETTSLAGPRLVLSWDRASDVIGVRDRDASVSYEFGPGPVFRAGEQVVRHLTAIADRHGNRVTFGRENSGVPALLTHSGGYQVAVDTEYLAQGQPRVTGLRMLSPQDADPVRLLGYEYDRAGRLAGVSDSSGVPLRYEWDDSDRITAWLGRGGYRFAYYYDEYGRVERTEGENGYLSGSFEYRDEERLTRYINSLGQVTEHHYDEDGNVVRVVDPLGHAERTEYDSYGQVVAATDKSGARTEFEFDERGNNTRITHADGAVVLAEYDAQDNLARVTEPGGATWGYEYSETGDPVSSTDPLGAITRYAYSETGALVSVTDPLGATTVVTHDDAGLMLSVTDPSGATWTARRDPFGQVTAQTDPLGAETAFSYDGEGRLVSRTGPDGTSETWSYDADGNLVRHEDEAGAVTVFEPGPFQRVAARVDADGTRYAFTYDTELRLTRVEGPLGHAWTYAHDAAGNLAAETDFNGRRLTYAHDPVGRVVQWVNGVGQSVELTLDVLGRIVEQYAEGSSSAVFTYDTAGNLATARNAEGEIAFTWDQAGHVLSESENGRQTTSAYDPAGRRVSLTTPSGRTSTWAYDPAGNLAEFVVPGRRVSFGRDAAGQESYRWLSPDIALTRQWDGRGRETSIRLLAVEGPSDQRTSRSLHERAYTYRPDGIIARTSDSVIGDRDYGLDAIGRVTTVTGQNWRERYAYDLAGNLIQSDDSRDQDSPETGERELAGTLLRRAGRTRYEYDDQGRLVKAVRRTLSGQSREWAYTYDAYDRLTTASNPDGTVWEYRYDALGRRISKFRRDTESSASPSEVTHFAWDGAVLIEQEHADAASGRVTVTAWDYQPGTWTPIAQASRSHLADAPQEVIDQRFHAIVTDPVGTPTELLDPDSGAVVWRPHTDLWGRQVSVDRDRPDTDCPLRHPGQYHDSETGLYYNCRRYYDPATGRYTGPDPLGLAPAPNPHAYVPNPLRWTDPLGLAAKWNQTFGNRTLAFNAARDHAGVPRSAQPIRQWTVGGDPTQAGNPNYLYRPYDPSAPTNVDPRAGWGRYYQYDTPQGQRVIAEHVADPTAPNPHFHAGRPSEGSPRDIDMRGKTYKQIEPRHHLYYPEDSCGG